MTNSFAASPDGEIVAKAGRYYRNTRYIMTLVLIGAGLWFGYDGWIGYPKENEKARALGGVEKLPYNEASINLQKILALSLPPVGVALLIWTLYNSRGAYRYRNDILSVPGHPDVPLDAIREIDKTKWDRKGIAYLEYEVPAAKGRLRLDDFIYERQPTDDILARIEERLTPPGEAQATTVAEQA